MSRTFDKQLISQFGAKWAPFDEHIYRYLRSSAGTENAIGDYSTTETFFLQPAADEDFAMVRMLVQVRDAGALSAADYGNINGGLTNGVTAHIVNGSNATETNLTEVPIQTNADWGRQCYDSVDASFGAGNNFILVRWTFEKAGKQIALRGAQGDRLEVRFADDLSDLTGHYFLAQGYKT